MCRPSPTTLTSPRMWRRNWPDIGSYFRGLVWSAVRGPGFPEIYRAAPACAGAVFIKERPPRVGAARFRGIRGSHREDFGCIRRAGAAKAAEAGFAKFGTGARTRSCHDTRDGVGAVAMAKVQARRRTRALRPCDHDGMVIGVNMIIVPDTRNETYPFGQGLLRFCGVSPSVAPSGLRGASLYGCGVYCEHQKCIAATRFAA